MKPKAGTKINMKLSTATVALLRDYQHVLQLPTRTAAVEHAIQAAAKLARKG